MTEAPFNYRYTVSRAKNPELAFLRYWEEVEGLLKVNARKRVARCNSSLCSAECVVHNVFNSTDPKMAK